MSDSKTATYDEGKSIEELFPDDDMIDHVIDSTGMYAGTRKPTELVEYVAEYKDDKLNIIQSAITYPPALYKCIDEAIVNALDNMVRLFGYDNGKVSSNINDNCVTLINLSFGRDGRITVRNNGRGVPIGMHNIAKIWSVQMIFGNMFKGRKKSDKESKVTGDANRVGIKLANILSTDFSVETVFRNPDNTATKYSQKWYDHMRKVDPPAIVQNVHSLQYTEVSFMPDYLGMFYTAFTEQVWESLDELFRLRMYTAAAYAGYYTNGQCRVSYQDSLINIKSMTDLAALMFDSTKVPIFTTNLTDTTQSPPYNWEVCVAIAPNDASNMKNIAQITNVNGVNVRIGKHISSISTQIIDNVREHILKKIKSTDIKFQPSYVYNNMFIFINAQIPGVEWQGQRKDEMLCDTKKIANYKLPEPFIKKIAASLEDEIMSLIYGKASVTGISRKRVNVKKYQAATKCGKEPEKCFLLCPEGDSAASMICNGIAYIPKGSKKPLLGFDYYGYLTLGGVIMNARKEITIKLVKGKKCMDLSTTLAANDFFNALLEVTGLDLNSTYDPSSPTYKKEKSLLKYGGIIGCVDQDHDGSGFIFPLLCNVFEIFWPNLLIAGYLKKWDTPRRRVTLKSNKKSLIEFYSDYEYFEWEKQNPSRNNTSYYDIDYIKGLAGHEESAVFRMFRHFQDNVITMYPDADTPRAFEVMFGRESSLRKDWLKTPVINPTPQQDAERRVSRKSSLTLLIHNEGKEHAMSNLQQKLWSAIDGMNESGRKILDGSLKVFTSAKEKMKVVMLQGHILAHEHYQHGESSLQESIVGKALLCVGAVQLPQLLPRSNFGTRRMGGGIKDGDSGHPRYISASLNKKLTDKLYPDADYANYEFVYEDGKRVEPKYFVPLLPMAILESTHMPAHGWKIQTWARDVLATIKVIKYMINIYDTSRDDSQIADMPIAEINPDTRGFKGTFRELRGTQHCFGDYVFNPKTRILNITELPLRVWTQIYTDSLTEEHDVKGPDGKVVTKSSKANMIIYEGTGKNKKNCA